jgi:hypothetical protein
VIGDSRMDLSMSKSLGQSGPVMGLGTSVSDA